MPIEALIRAIDVADAAPAGSRSRIALMPSGIRPIAAPWSARPEIISVTDGATRAEHRADDQQAWRRSA